MEQLRLKFSKSTIHNIKIYQEAAKSESRTDGSQVKLTPTQKQAIQSICKEQGINVSAFIYDALDSHIEFFPYKNKIKRHKQLLLNMLKSLP